ncbi:unnamed protein product [Gadus morhua 'NCC']
MPPMTIISPRRGSTVGHGASQRGQLVVAVHSVHFWSTNPKETSIIPTVRVDDVHRVVEGDAGLCDVGGQDDLQDAGNNNRRWKGKGGFQAAGQAEEHTGVPLPRLNLLPLSCPIGQLDATPPSRRYFLLDQSQPEYYR